MITVADLKGTKMRQTMHLDGARGPNGYFVNFYVSEVHPRLEQKITVPRARGKLGTRQLFVDGIEVVGLQSVADALNRPQPIDAKSVNPFAGFMKELDRE